MAIRSRFVAALIASCLGAAACIATLIEPRWFELLFDASPDGGDGSLETAIAVALSLVACLAFAWLARREWRRGRRDADAAAARTGARP